MKKFLFFFSTVMLVLVMVGNASAIPSYTFDMGANSWIDTSGTNDALEMYANVNSNLDDIIYTLQEGESKTFYFATLGTTETWINKDDLNPGTLTAYVDFDNPDLVQAIGGTSVGFTGLFHFRQGWNLTWEDPVIVDFGNDGQFQIELSDVGYSSWFWQGPDGSADVFATVSLNSAPAPVPEPATVLLLGIGLFGIGGYGRKRSAKMAK